MSERVRYPVGEAAAIEASGMVGPLPDGLAELLRARDAWLALERPLEAARCELLHGQRQLEADPEQAAITLQRAAREYEALGVMHLAARARELSPT